MMPAPSLRLILLVCVLSLGLAAGCRKRTQPGSPAATPAGDSPGAGAAAAGPISQPTTPPPDVTKLSPEEVLHFLNDAARNYYADKSKLPASVEELYSSGYLKQRYNPPPGRRFVINPQSQAVELR